MTINAYKGFEKANIRYCTVDAATKYVTNSILHLTHNFVKKDYGRLSVIKIV